jgi:hypothetical protein
MNSENNRKQFYLPAEVFLVRNHSQESKNSMNSMYQPQFIFSPFHISLIFIFQHKDHDISIAQTNFQKLPLKLEGSRAY